jgi:hypothetical protein
MNDVKSRRVPNDNMRAVCLAAATAMFFASGCSQQRAVPPPPVDDTRVPSNNGGPAFGNQPQPRPAAAPAPTHSGLSGGQKLVLLAGAAALYYLYRRHQNAAAQTGEAGQYYLSKNGRVYYRDAEHRAHWVTPPPGGIPVPADEAAGYAAFQGYDNRTTGRDLTGLGADATN